MKTKKIKIYTFDELSEEAKEKAISNLSDINVDHQWWESTYEDAKNVGIKITSSDDYKVEGKFIEDACHTAHKIKEEHGVDCETYKTAVAFLAERDEIVNKAPKDEDGEYEDESELDENLDACEEEFRKSILEDYRIMLRREYEYLTGKEAIIETIKANEYHFKSNGKLESEQDED